MFQRNSYLQRDTYVPSNAGVPGRGRGRACVLPAWMTDPNLAREAQSVTAGLSGVPLERSKNEGKNDVTSTSDSKFANTKLISGSRFDQKPSDTRSSAISDSRLRNCRSSSSSQMNTSRSNSSDKINPDYIAPPQLNDRMPEQKDLLENKIHEQENCKSFKNETSQDTPSDVACRAKLHLLQNNNHDLKSDRQNIMSAGEDLDSVRLPATYDTVRAGKPNEHDSNLGSKHIQRNMSQDRDECGNEQHIRVSHDRSINYDKYLATRETSVLHHSKTTQSCEKKGSNFSNNEFSTVKDPKSPIIPMYKVHEKEEDIQRYDKARHKRDEGHYRRDETSYRRDETNYRRDETNYIRDEGNYRRDYDSRRSRSVQRRGNDLSTRPHTSGPDFKHFSKRRGGSASASHSCTNSENSHYERKRRCTRSHHERCSPIENKTKKQFLNTADNENGRILNCKLLCLKLNEIKNLSSYSRRKSFVASFVPLVNMEEFIFEDASGTRGSWRTFEKKILLNQEFLFDTVDISRRVFVQKDEETSYCLEFEWITQRDNKGKVISESPETGIIALYETKNEKLTRCFFFNDSCNLCSPYRTDISFDAVRTSKVWGITAKYLLKKGLLPTCICCFHDLTCNKLEDSLLVNTPPHLLPASNRQS